MNFKVVLTWFQEKKHADISVWVNILEKRQFFPEYLAQKTKPSFVYYFYKCLPL
ncbi:MAG: hypothetical protein JWQ14_2448 [Adhaeribacter sp.]|jgi:hypothetical protein|nr:hypothetical protein [Adhaeribacter sp.]